MILNEHPDKQHMRAQCAAQFPKMPMVS